MTYQNQQLKYGDRVEIYRNLHKNCFSVRKNGRVVRHVFDHEKAYLEDVKFAVQPAGRKKVLREQRKNVHAFIRGTYINRCPGCEKCKDFLASHNQQATYNPYKRDHFVTQEYSENACAIYHARSVILKEGKAYVQL